MTKRFDYDRFLKSLPPRKPDRNEMPACRCVGSCKGPIYGSRCKQVADKLKVKP